MRRVGVVAIGRNEGERLRKCLRSAVGEGRPVVYVDSGSTDGSINFARAMEVDVIDLDMRIPFTAARARNTGYRRLRDTTPDLDYVQFVDGDCELTAGWLEKASAFLNDHYEVAAVSGRLREKQPSRSIYNMLCDMEWEAPAGPVKACGGITMIRMSAFGDVHGFVEELIAGEEPELCVRLRSAGWRIWRLSDDMATHDAAILCFNQWWKRTLRGGYAFAQGVYMHGATPERHCVRESISIWFWGLGLPVIAMGLSIFWKGWALLLLSIYPVQIVRLAIRGERSARQNWWRALFLMLGKFPEVIGQIKFIAQRCLKRKPRLIEYK